jgi:hypothetical protein
MSELTDPNIPSIQESMGDIGDALLDISSSFRDLVGIFNNIAVSLSALADRS